MSWFKIPLIMCLQNIRKWANDYRIWATGILIIVIVIQSVIGVIPLSKEIGTGIAPWIFPFIGNSWWGTKVLMLIPLLILFCDAPFIDANQPYIIARSGRYRWSIGQVLYIITASAIYLLTLMVLSIVFLIGNMELTLEWGTVINTASNFPERLTDGGIGFYAKILYYFTPLTAMLYSFLLQWLAAIFLGLVIYVVNSLSGKSGYGVMAGGLLIFGDVVVSWVTYDGRMEFLNYFSPISWCSLDRIDIEGTLNTPSITYVLCAYAVLIVGLSVTAVLMSKKQQINVVQAV